MFSALAKIVLHAFSLFTATPEPKESPNPEAIDPNLLQNQVEHRSIALHAEWLI
jgi:hypothetical protein